MDLFRWPLTKPASTFFLHPRDLAHVRVSGSSDLHPPKKHHQTLSLTLAQRKGPRAEREFNQYTATILETFNNSAPTTAQSSLQLTHGVPTGRRKGIEEVVEVVVATAATFRESCMWALCITSSHLTLTTRVSRRALLLSFHRWE